MANRDQFNLGMILPSLKSQLKSILHQYPDDSQILKELIQNADDARASKIVFLLDSSSYAANPGRLHSPGLAAYQGPALCVYNDAVFTPDDWKGITMLSDSVKANDEMKVGRFGLGFKSVFHITDLPGIFSGNGIGFLDPHQTFFRSSARLWDLTEDGAEIERLSDQFAPFHQGLFGVGRETFERGSYDGTLFRLPLRTDGMKSDLCDTKCSPRKIRELLETLGDDAHVLLLFMKSLRCIEVYEKTADAGDNCTKIMSINIKDGSVQPELASPPTKRKRTSVQDKRLELFNAIEARQKGGKSDAVAFAYSLDVELQRHSKTSKGTAQKKKKQKQKQKKEEEEEEETAEEDQKVTSQWTISHYCAGLSELESVSGVGEQLKLLPWVGVALQVPDKKTPSYLTTPKGRLFCFLPLPLEEDSPTGLRVHVHGCFAVDSNRRHIKWPAADQNPEQLTDKELIWNVFLVNRLTVRAMVNLSRHLARPDVHELVFDVVPADHVTPQWKRMADGFYEELGNLDIFLSQSSDKWLNCGNALFDNCEDQSATLRLVRRILVQARVDFVSVPSFLKRHFANHVTPPTVCEAFKKVQAVLALTDQERFTILEYLLENFPRGTELIGINLLPLARDGEWTEFKKFTVTEGKVYVESTEHPKTILPSLDTLFLRQNISVLDKMKELARNRTTQLVMLDPQSVVDLLHLVFPNSWKDLTEASLDSAPGLTMEWLTDLWQYLTRHFPRDLRAFEDFLILPIGQNRVARLACETPVVLSSHYGTDLEEDVASALVALGLKVIDGLPDAVRGHQDVVGKYVLPPDAASVLLAMNRLASQGSLRVASLSDANKESLLRYLAASLAGNSALVSTYRSLLATLPVFKTVDGSGFRSAGYVSVASVNQGTQSDMNIPVRLPSAFIDLKLNLVRDLAINLGVTQENTAGVLESCVFSAVNGGSLYDLDGVKALMSFVCDNFHHLQTISQRDFRSSVSNVRFILKRNGDLVTAREVFDNSDRTLCSLFADGNDVFPVDEFANPKYTHILRQLGMKDHTSVTAGDLLLVGEQLDSSSANPDVLRAKTFLDFLEHHPHLLAHRPKTKTCTLHTALLTLKWVKPEPHRPLNYPKALGFVGDRSNSLVLPSDVCSTQFGLVIGSVRPTVDTGRTPQMADRFAWTNLPTVDEVVCHLLNVTSSCSDQNMSETRPVAKAVYEFLNESIAGGSNRVEEILSNLTDRSWIWTEEEFIPVNRVVMTKPFADLRPHVYQLPAELRAYSHLWSLFRMAENVDLVEILKEIQSLHDATPSGDRSSRVARDVQLAVAILNHISNLPSRNELLDELLIPIKTRNDDLLCMKRIQEVTYCDKEWFQRGHDVHDLVDDDVYLVHPLLSPETAEALNIHGVIHRVLNAEELGIGFESYGQSEPLTRRLSSILKDYTDGLTVLKELVQNADDAGATEVRFLYDERRNDDARTLLFDKGMAELQGPALWAYNDAVFTDRDFENLVKLSGATKETSKDKIGHFGLGFNAVYNLTDVPSLVSREYVVFLDPHTKYLGRAIRDKCKPGIKLQVGGNRRKLMPMKDQFRPYDGIFGCNFGEKIGGGGGGDDDRKVSKMSYPGTLFRFPLRTAQQAATSEICNRVYTHDELIKLLKVLNRSSDSLLLFTQNVRKIAVFHLPEDKKCAAGIEEWFRVEKSLVMAIRSLDPTGNDGEIARESAILKVASGVLESTAEPPTIESSIIISVSCENSTRYAEKQKARKGVSRSHWLVSSCLGRGASFAMAKAEKDLTPVGGVAAKLRKTEQGFEPVRLNSGGSSAAADRAMMFCFLPLPVESRFPVHVNGSFALTQSRTHIYETAKFEDKPDRRSRWNEALIKDAIAQAYVILLEDLLKVCHSCDSYAVWPVHKSLKEAGSLSILTESLYEKIFDAKSAPKILRENNRLVSMAECRYLETNFRSETVGETALSVLRSITSSSEEDFYVTDVPADVYATAKETSVANQLEAKKITKLEFLQRFFLPNVQMVDATSRDMLILHALFDPNSMELLRNVACIPVKPGSVLKKCSQLIHPSSLLAVLYEADDACFPEFRMTYGAKLTEVHSKLVELGMREHDLSWKEIAERCGVVTRHDELVKRRLDTVIKLMSNKVSQITQPDLVFIEEIKTIRFLPTKQKPRGFPLPWKGDYLKSTSCNEGFGSHVEKLVCCIHPIINDHRTFGHENIPLKSFLGICKKDILEADLLRQFAAVLDLPKDPFGYATELSADGVDHVKNICREIYARFEKLARENQLSQRSVELLTNMRVRSIFIDGSRLFLHPRNCVLHLEVPSESLLPYLGQIPKSMTSLGNLLNKLQVRQSFQIRDFADALDRLYAKFSGVPLGKRELQVAVCIVNSCLPPEILKYREGKVKEGLDLTKVYVPDAQAILFPVESLCYNDCPWMPSDGHHFCSDEITHKAASAIGMRTIREAFIGECSIGIAFGQREKLVTRLRRILNGYPFVEEILKEMLQNADDARATEIHFINDRRHLPTERVFEDRWKPLQGPALCVFNDRPFTPQDIDGIRNLGEGSKSDDPTKTGQYGVGFNCVYHVTEAPSFLTELVDVEQTERLLIAFDPTLKFVPGSTEANPGLMMRNIDRLKTQFPDVFAGYFEGHYGQLGGTMFRLPLRNALTAGQKDYIKNEAVTSDDVEKLFENFKTVMYESLLFLNSVEKIQLKNSEAECRLTTVYSVEIEMTAEAKQARDKFNEKVNNLSKALKDKVIDLRQVCATEVSYELITVDSNGDRDTWQIVQRFGFDDSNCVSDALSAAHRRGDIGLLPRGGVAHLKSTNRKKTKNSARRLFCFLPLPVQIGFPSHVNGHFALNHETRRSLWIDENEGLNTEWNKCMVRQVIAPAYCTLIQAMRNSLNSGGGVVTNSDVYRFVSLFPCINEKDGVYMELLSKAIYERIWKENLAVLPVWWPANEGKHLWIGPRGMNETTWKMWRDMGWDGSTGMDQVFGYFDSLRGQIDGTGASVFSLGSFNRRKSEIVRSSLVESGFLLINGPLSVRENFATSGITVKTVSPSAVISFFASYGKPNTLCRLKSLPQALSETPFRIAGNFYRLLEYITEYRDYKSHLIGLPLLLTADGYLRCFDSETVRYEPYFSDLIACIENQFFDNETFHILKLSADTDVHLCRAFTVKEFSRELPRLLPTEVFNFRASAGPVEIATLKNMLKDGTLKWLARLWEFLFVCQKSLETYLKQTSHSLREVVLPLSDWCLLPVRFRQNEFLFPMCKSRSVLDFSGQTTLQKHLISCLQKIGVPQSLYEYFPGFNSDVILSKKSRSVRMYSQVLGTLEDPCSVLSALELVLKCGTVEAKLTISECSDLCRYLAGFLQSWKPFPTSIDTVRRLPIFTTVYDMQVPLLNSFVYVIPSEIPIIDMESWTAKQGIIFLKSNTELSDLFKFLGCATLTKAEVYCSYILKHFEMLSEHGQLVHLRYVRDKLLKKDQDQKLGYRALIELLKELAFLPTIGGTYARAEDFYDRLNPVFRAMQKEEEFPRSPYDAPEWNEFLRKCGMISSVSQAKFCEYVLQIEEQAAISICEELRQKSMILSRHLFDRNDIGDTRFMSCVKCIRFVAPYVLDSCRKRLHDVCGKKNNNGQNMFISFKNAITPDNRDLVWTVQHILPPEAVPSGSGRRIAISSLEIQEKANPETVAEHMKRLCSKLAPDVHRLQSDFGKHLASVLKNCYSYLQSNMRAVAESSSVLSTLKATPCIFDSVNRLLLRPEQVVVRMRRRDEIKPYLVGLPDELGEFKQLFRLLGSTEDDATIDQLCMVLEMIHGAAGSAQLSPNERDAVCLATGCLFKLLMEDKKPVTLERQLFLPATDEKLQKSSEILVDNDHDLRKRMKQFGRPFLIDLEKNVNLKLSDAELVAQINKLPVCRQPKFLTSVIREDMEAADIDNELDIVKRLNERMTSEPFREGIMRLVWHDDRQREERNEQEIKTIIEDSIRRIRCAGTTNKIRTYLVFQGSRIEGSEKEEEIFIKGEVVDEINRCTVFVAPSIDRITQNIVYHKIALTIQRFTSLILSAVCLEHMLDCDEHDHISTVLDKHGIKRSSRPGKSARTFKPRPGQFVPIALHHMLKQDVLRLEVGTYAALEFDDPVDDATESDIEQHLSAGDGEDEKTLLPTYIVVKIIEICLDETRDPRRASYKVDDGSTVRLVPAVSLYAFHRSADDAKHPNWTRQEEDDHDDTECKAATLDDIRQTLSYAWTLSEETRSKFVRRLLLRWHPDTNSDNVQMATKATKFVFDEIRRLTNDSPAPTSTSRGSYSGGSYSGAFYNYIGRRARKHREALEGFRRNYEQNTANCEDRYLRYFAQSFTTLRNPQPGEGRRWLRQAQWDLKAVDNDRSADGRCQSGEWASFKCYQAALKALRGAQYARDSNSCSVSSKDLVVMARAFEKPQLNDWALQLKQLLRGSSYMLYPADHPHPKIPHDVFDAGIIQTAQQLSTSIVDWCKDYIA